MQRLDRPTGTNELVCQPVQQFRMCGTLTQFAEVVRCTDEPLPEMPLPNAIHQDTRRQRVLWIGNPSCQFEASAPLVDGRLILSDKEFRKMAGDALSQPRVTPTNVNRHVLDAGEDSARRSAILDAQRLRWRRKQRSLECVPLGGQPADRGTRLAGGVGDRHRPASRACGCRCDGFADDAELRLSVSSSVLSWASRSSCFCLLAR